MFDVDDALLARYGALSLPRLGKVWALPLLVAAMTMPRLWRAVVRADGDAQESYFRAAANIVLRPLGETLSETVREPEDIIACVRKIVENARTSHGEGGVTGAALPALQRLDLPLEARWGRPCLWLPAARACLV